MQARNDHVQRYIVWYSIFEIFDCKGSALIFPQIMLIWLILSSSSNYAVGRYFVGLQIVGSSYWATFFFTTYISKILSADFCLLLADAHTAPKYIAPTRIRPVKQLRAPNLTD